LIGKKKTSWLTKRFADSKKPLISQQLLSDLAPAMTMVVAAVSLGRSLHRSR
jgi:hypothetical protein